MNYYPQGLPLVVTSAPLFTQKAALFPGSTFVVGHDTAIRMVMTRYYGDSFESMLNEFEKLRRQGCRVLVGGRKEDGSGAFRALSDVAVPTALADLFSGIPESDFRVDISSTEIRARMARERQAAAATGSASAAPAPAAAAVPAQPLNCHQKR